MELNQSAAKRQRIRKPVALYRDDAGMAPTTTEGTGYVYMAVSRPESTLLSGQWEVMVPFTQLDQAWTTVALHYPHDLKNVPVVKCPTLRRIYQDHAGHHENFYRETQSKQAAIAFYVADCTNPALLRQTFKSVEAVFPRYKIGFSLHEQQLTGRKAGFVFVDEMNRMRLNEPLYESFCQRNMVRPQALKGKEKIGFVNKYAGTYEWKDLPEQFVVLDTETTGMDYVQGSITEIAAVAVQKTDLRVIGEFNMLINIGEQKLDRFIVRLTGITDALLKKEGRPVDQVLGQLRSFVQAMPIVAHNARFDKGFVDMAFMKSGMKMLPNRWIDSIDILHTALPGRPSYSLTALGEELLDDFKQKHRAMADVLAVIALLHHAKQRAS